MGLSMSERRAVTRETSARYRRASKKQKAKILDEFVETSGYHRKYASWILSNWGKKRYCVIDGQLVQLVVGQPKKRRRPATRPRKYDERVFKALKKVWFIWDCPCGRRMVPVLRNMLAVLYKFGELQFDAEVDGKLRRISAATIDRMLRREKKMLRLKGRSHTKPASLLKQQIPVRTFDGWDENRPGFVEIDLVGHEGGVSHGEFAFTLNLTDVCTGWTEPRAVKNKAQRWTVQALDEIKALLPFALLGIDSDNGSEFLNAHLVRYCSRWNIIFTRSRPYRKNDNCFVEQKNNDIVRRYVGYQRYEGEQQVALLNELYDKVRLFVNFFQPSAKLIKKTRQGSKVKKVYDEPQTPCQRLLCSPYLPETAKCWLREQFDSLNPAQLQRSIRKLQMQLYGLAPTEAITAGAAG
jgi:hypothetical protein